MNVSARYLKHKEHHKSVDACSKALAEGCKVSKAFFRMGPNACGVAQLGQGQGRL